jgi:hypothetical protein
MKRIFEMKGNRDMRAKCKKDEKWTEGFFFFGLLLLFLLAFDLLPDEC